MAPPGSESSPASPPAPDAGRPRWLRRAVLATVLVATFTVGIGVGRVTPLGGFDGASTGASGTAAQEFDLIRQAWDTLHREYVGRAELDDRELAYGAIRGLTEAVGDTGHTSFLTPEERAAKADELSGTYVGIGIRMDAAEDGSPLVVGVFKGSPAEAAGVQTGDLIEAVDGKTTAGHELDEIASWVRGEAGSSVELTVRAKAGGAARTYTITRADVPIESVSWTLVPGTTTALLRLDSFSHGSADDIVVALKDIQKAGADRLVLDLRGNPGGFVGEATGIASQFIRSGDVFVERDADGNETRHAVSPDGVALDMPLDVLVDQGTASSAEILSGALQDAGRAQVVGVGTFGTGTVLGEFELSDGSALRIGTVEWLTPKGRRIWHEGITPDIVVERPSEVTPLTPDEVRDMTPAAISSMTDPQLARALSVVASR